MTLDLCRKLLNCPFKRCRGQMQNNHQSYRCFQSERPTSWFCQERVLIVNMYLSEASATEETVEALFKTRGANVSLSQEDKMSWFRTNTDCWQPAKICFSHPSFQSMTFPKIPLAQWLIDWLYLSSTCQGCCLLPVCETDVLIVKEGGLPLPPQARLEWTGKGSLLIYKTKQSLLYLHHILWRCN